MTKTTNTSLRTDMGSEELAQMLRPDPHRPGPAQWRLADFNIPVWTIIQHMQAIGDLDNAPATPTAIIAQTAADYAIPEATVRAALTYYGRNRAAIDTLIADNTIATST